MTDPATIEAAARAMCDGRGEDWGLLSDGDREWYRDLAGSAIPLIEAAALEGAAKVAEKHTNWPATVPETWAREEIAAAIRALNKPMEKT